MIQIKFKCSDSFGSFESESCGFVADGDDASAICWGNEEIARIRERWNDLVLSDCVLIQPDLSPDFHTGDRFISNIN